MRLFLASLVSFTLVCLPTATLAQDKDKDDVSPDLAALIKGLRNKQSKIRIKAAEDIGKLGEEAAPAAKPLCNAMMDGSAKVATAALDSLEKVRPDLYKPLSTLVLDSTPAKQLAAVKEIGLMGEKANPAMKLLLARLRTELSRPRSYNQRGLSEMSLAYFAAIRQIKPDDAETVKLFRVMAGLSDRDSYARLESLIFLEDWAGEDESKRKEVLSLLNVGLDDAVCQLNCIQTAGGYGVLAKDFVPKLKKLKLSSLEQIRDAAGVAADKIENP
jgi:HEAT repeat protein